MFYRPDQPHGLRGNPLNALVVPRPIGWISTLSPAGRRNLAPYSFFNAVAYQPLQVMFAATGPHDHGGLKDSIANIEATGEFVLNFATWELREAVNASSIGAPHGSTSSPTPGSPRRPPSGQAAARRREPGPPRVRAVADRRARIRRRRTAPTG